MFSRRHQFLYKTTVGECKQLFQNDTQLILLIEKQLINSEYTMSNLCKTPSESRVSSEARISSASKSLAAKQEAQEKLEESFSEFKKCVRATKVSFSTFKSKTFFFPEPQFLKEFSECIKRVDQEVTAMDCCIRKLSAKDTDAAKETTPAQKQDQLESGTQFSDANGNDQILQQQETIKADEAVSITPPASEAGNDDEVGSTAVIPKTETEQREFRDRSSNKRQSKQETEVSKKPRTSLISKFEASVAQAQTVETKEREEPGEYEVESIENFKKSQGIYYYFVSWQGYGPQDNTWEPSNNLGGCEELLEEFYKMRLKKRERVHKSERNYLVLPPDPEYTDLLRQTVISYVLQNIEEEEWESFFTVVPRQENSKLKVAIDDLADKVIAAKMADRFDKMMESLKHQLMLKEAHKKRQKQLAVLRSWERHINSICSDPAKLMVENNVDWAVPPSDFIYINDFKEGPGVTIPTDPVVGCECEDCFNNQKGCCANQMNSHFAYNKYSKLKVSLGTPVYECNKMCKCGPKCVNRVVQNGRNIALSIFRTANGRGWGVKAMEAIRKNSFVTEYVGEVITSEEAEHRGQIYDARGCTYLFDLDYNNGDQNPYTVDAATYGNVSHFINHSCDPNLVVYNIWVNCLDPDLPRLGLFAVCDIRKGEELTFDYNSGLQPQQLTNGVGFLSEEDEKKEEVPVDPPCTPEKSGASTRDMSSPAVIMKTPKGNRGLQYGKTECRCGAANCRKYFF